jgi:hypothetical protein
VPELWVVGDGLGAASAPGAQAINRMTGVVAAQVSFVDVVAPVEVVSDGSVLWTFGNGLSGGSSFDATVDPDSGRSSRRRTRSTPSSWGLPSSR